MFSKKTIWLLVIAALAFLFAFGVYTPRTLPQLEKVARDIISEVPAEVSAPTPLRAVEQHDGAVLSKEGVLDYTNKKRMALGIKPLVSNIALDVAAKAKINDMFLKQYFAHVSPSGQTAGDLADGAGYISIATGENLALGNFENDKALVDEWMNSPGHRANILRSSFEEIGVAVKKGTFEGETTWLAVQIFGRPRSSCPVTDTALLNAILSKKAEVATLENEIKIKKSEIDASSRENRDDYNRKIDEYNLLVKRYNELSQELTGMVETYNEGVKIVNRCINAGSEQL